MAKRPDFLLHPDWMERPFFGRDFLYRDSRGWSQTTGRWTDDGLGCLGLRPFLENQTGGLFLVAGPRGMGKTSLVRRVVREWEENGTPEEPHKSVFLNAADLGLLDQPKQEALERSMIAGLARALSVAIHPGNPCNGREGAEPPSRMWRLFLGLSRICAWLFPPANQRSKTCAVKLSVLAELAEAEEASLKKDLYWSLVNQLIQEASAKLGTKSDLWEASGALAFKRSGEEKTNQQTSLKTHLNRTDLLRSTLRWILHYHPEVVWPVIVIDEWDRFPENQAEKTNGSSNPSEDALLALSRLKSLLADYPAPIIIVSGVELYGLVKSSRQYTWSPAQPNPDDAHSKPRDSYENIFQYLCFLAPPLPLAQTQSEQSPLLAPYLQVLVETVGGDAACQQKALHQLSDFLLFHIGPNPHTMKQFLARFVQPVPDQDRYRLAIRWDRYAVLQMLFARAMLSVWRDWEREYFGFMAPDSLQRMLWFWYLYDRMQCYWHARVTHLNNDLCLPYFPYDSHSPVPIRLLQALDPPSGMEYGRYGASRSVNIPDEERQWVDSRLLHQFRMEISRHLSSSEEATAEEVETWNHWREEGLVAPLQEGGEGINEKVFRISLATFEIDEVVLAEDDVQIEHREA